MTLDDITFTDYCAYALHRAGMQALHYATMSHEKIVFIIQNYYHLQDKFNC